MSEEHENLGEALLYVQAEAPAIQKTGLNPAFKRPDGKPAKYVSLDLLMETVMPVLNKHGLVWLTFPISYGEEHRPSLKYQLWHVGSGEKIEGTMPLMLARNDSQGQGSAITYARRYSLMAVLGLVADADDDGNTASKRESNGEEFATPDDVKSMVAAAKDLTPDQVKLALAACGIPNVKTYGQVPRAKTAELAKRLAGIER